MSIDAPIERLTEADIPDALQLSAQAGWNQAEADWRRLLSLWSATCFGWREDGRLIATSTLAHYGQGLGWIGMLLVDPRRRGQGIGTAMLRAAHDAGSRLGLPCIGLDATDLGKPIYAREGFMEVCGVARWQAQLSAPLSAHETNCLQDQDWPAVLALDRRTIGIDRAAMLQALPHEPGAHARVIQAHNREINSPGDLAGFGFARPGRLGGYIGPVVAKDDAFAEKLISSLMSDLSAGGERRVFIDALDIPRHAREMNWLRSHGFTLARRLTRMARGDIGAIGGDARGIFAIAALELG
jgi:GNAT superfamily N-acetyltransferase